MTISLIILGAVCFSLGFTVNDMLRERELDELKQRLHFINKFRGKP